MFIHLHVHSTYSFLNSASSVTSYLERAAQLGMPGLALTDHHNLSGTVELHKKARELGIMPIQGAEITMEDGSHLTLLRK